MLEAILWCFDIYVQELQVKSMFVLKDYDYKDYPIEKQITTDLTAYRSFL